MAGQLTLRVQGILAKTESSYGVDPTPDVATDAVRLAEPAWNIINVGYAWENLRTDITGGALLPAAPGTPHGRMVSLDLNWEVKGKGSDAVTEASALLQACGFTEADGTAMFTYTLAAPPHASCTIYAYAGGMLFKVTGCRGTVRWPHRPGENGRMRFQMQGIMTTDPVTSAVPAITGYDSTNPIACVSYGLSIGTFDPVIVTQAEFVQGATLQRLDSLNAADGIGQFDWSYPNPQITMTVLGPNDGTGKWDTANFNPWEDADSRTSRTIDWTQGNTQFNRWRLNAPGCYVKMPQHTVHQDFVAVDLTYDLTDDTTYLRSD